MIKSLITSIFIATICAIGLLSCDKMDDNGPFEGYWLLTERDGYQEADFDPNTRIPVTEGGHTPSDIQVTTSDYITWGVRNNLIQMRNLQKGVFFYYTFTRTDNDLNLTSAYQNDGTNDTKLEFGEIPAEFCIPADGHFSIVSLTRSEMILQSGDIKLKFKKN